MTDAEILSKADDEFWYTDLCISELHRLPSEIEPLVSMREYTALQAYNLVKRAMNDMIRVFRG